MSTPNTAALRIANLDVRVHRLNTVVIGSGAAGFNAAINLWKRGQKNVALLTEGVNMGTSRNTGSDKQTYYKLTTCGTEGDSVRAMAETLFSGGATDGDTALAEAALSAQCFFHLVDIGVPFPHNAYGEYIGYKTDHDPFKRGTSAGPLTSKFMTECLQAELESQGVPVFDRHQVVEILTTGAPDNAHVIGLLALDLANLDDPNRRYVLFSVKNIVFATGGEAGMYKTSVYPASQTGSTGVAFRAGAKGKNLTESQFGIASIKFRWNLSGTYQQVLPRYISTDANGEDEKEFLDEYFIDPKKLLAAIFLKGYQWPFDPRKIANEGSSLVDILVHNETQIKNRRVFLDYTRNPSLAGENGGIDFSRLDKEVHDYLANSGALQATPFERLMHMNPAAVELYKNHGIDLKTEPLEIAVCAQHNNGGLAGDNWWQSNIQGLFPVGEVNGSHGVYRPGGTALNAGQVGSIRASQYIAHSGKGEPAEAAELIGLAGKQLEGAIRYGESALAAQGDETDLNAERDEIRTRMTKAGAHIRSLGMVEDELKKAEAQLARLENSVKISAPLQLRRLHQVRDLAVCHYVYLCAIRDYILQGGGSRGSFLVNARDGVTPAANLPDVFRFNLDAGGLTAKVQEIAYAHGECEITWRPVRPLPPEDDWFENVWKRYLSGEIYNKA